MPDSSSFFIDTLFIADPFVVTRTGCIVDNVMKIDKEFFRTWWQFMYASLYPC
jgi:hypothetical protein